VTRFTVTNSEIRNTGDDGIATWADSAIGAGRQRHDLNNTVETQILATASRSTAARNTVSGNLVVDSGISQGAASTSDQTLHLTALGTTNITNNTLIRDGDLERELAVRRGRVVFDGSQGAITGTDQRDQRADPAKSVRGVQWVEGTNQRGQPQQRDHPAPHLRPTGADRARRASPTSRRPGWVTPPRCTAAGRQLHRHRRRRANSGISGTPYCVPGRTELTRAVHRPRRDRHPGAPGLRLGGHRGGEFGQTVTVANPTGSAAAVSSVAVTGDFTQTNTCGSSIPANGSVHGQRDLPSERDGRGTGALTSTAGGITNTVSLSATAPRRVRC